MVFNQGKEMIIFKIMRSPVRSKCNTCPNDHCDLKREQERIKRYEEKLIAQQINELFGVK